MDFHQPGPFPNLPPLLKQKPFASGTSGMIMGANGREIIPDDFIKQANFPIIPYALDKLQAEATESLEAQIISFFGSEKVARLLAPYFVIESKPIEIHQETDGVVAGISFRLHRMIRIRPKTDKELEDEGLI